MVKASKKIDEAAAVWHPVESLVPWDKNPRINDHAVDDIASSIKRFGFSAPIVARRADSMVIAGHTRLKAAIKLGLTTVPVRFMDLDPADSELLALADNKLNEVAFWDDDELARILSGVGEEEALIAGFDEDETARLLALFDEVVTVELRGVAGADAPPAEPQAAEGAELSGPHFRSFQLLLDGDAHPVFMCNVADLRIAWSDESPSSTEVIVRAVAEVAARIAGEAD